MKHTFDSRVFLFFIIWYSIGVVLLTFDLVPPWLEWANVVFLITSGLIAMLYFYRSHAMIPGIITISMIFIFSMTIESIGVHTGLFFGEYSYMMDFGPKIAGVPITIGFAWVMVLATSHVLAAPVTKKIPRLKGLAYAIYGAIIATSLDLIIDPVAYEVKQYWVWHESGFYYNIPFSNFLGWFILSFVLHLILYIFFHRSRGWTNIRSPFWEFRMVLLYGMMMLLFMIVALVNGLILAVVLSLTLTVLYTGIYLILKGKTS
ncbi:carotenoid biosynthesis protein [Salisediminibacterium beveridgei]|uniref:Carotenoid biosynthesis protein n=1 Tax=Salisediminibacterium beveridgei TaxID=632773 RepID=A0A1D7QUR0_9BACI|nr:carotenoid biosynthesis protein [Salisediminibacterium beveridgei]AOM82729.1 hypothetical protein BBEV_1366 [Salisediminibacterium beveridgei]